MSRVLLRGSQGPLASDYDLALVDLDGTAWQGKNPIEHAAEGIAAARRGGLRLMFVTNNSSRPPEMVASLLGGLEIPTDVADVYSSAMAAAELARDRFGRGARVLVVGGQGLLDATADSGLVIVPSADDAPVAVIQGLAESVGWAELSEAAYAVARGAEHIATNLDSTLPNERGLAIGNGSLVAAVVNATGRQPVSAGKPEPEIYRLAAARTGAHHPLAVGDRLNTDIAGAVASGIDSLHVTTGVSGAREVILADPAERPTFLGRDLRDLTVAQPDVVADGEWARCREARARVADGTLEVAGHDPLTEGSAVTHDEYRALAAAAWAAGGVRGCPRLVVTP